MTVEALRARRPEVLADLLDQYGRELKGVAYLILRDDAAAEDVVADTLLAALDRGPSLRDPGALRPWLLRIATNQALGHRRKGARIVQIHLAPEPTTLGGWSEADDRAMLWQSVAALPPRTRAAVVLHYYADLPVDDVALALGVSRNTVKTQLKTALDRLRMALADTPSSLPEVRHA